jgi:hypothetical protein
MDYYTDVRIAIENDIKRNGKQKKEHGRSEELLAE